MLIKVFFYTARPSSITQKLVEQIAKQTISLAGFKNSHQELSVALLPDSLVQVLNHKYRKLNKPTDVLAFSGKTKKIPGIDNFLGEVVIARGVCQKQAKKHKHSFKKEFIILLIHGLLHLLGYDHQKNKQAIVMEDLEAKILKKIYEYAE
jgi:probable rRNA maturation factor